MYLSLEIKQAKILEDIILDKIQSGELNREECGEYSLLYSKIHLDIEHSEKEE